MYGLVKKSSLNGAPFHPRSVMVFLSVCFSYCGSLQEAYGIFASNGILFITVTRRPTFVTKIIQGLVRIKRVTKKLTLGNLYAIRDWGHAKIMRYQCEEILQHKNQMTG